MTVRGAGPGPACCLKHRQPERRLLTPLLLSIWFGGLLAFVVGLPDKRNEAVAGALVGGLLGILVARPERWELDGDEFRKVSPKREAGRIRLSEAQALEATRHPKGGFNLSVVSRHGYRVDAPTEPGQKGDSFRAELFQNLPAVALAGIDDPLVLELLARAAGTAVTEPPRA